MAVDLFARLERATPISPSTCPKIQRVPHHLRDRERFAKYYSPRFVSFGPIHHGDPRLQQGEEYKLNWARMYLRDINKFDLYLLITENIPHLKKFYTEDALRHINDEQLAEMLFVDGCSLLQIIKNPDLLRPEALNVKIDQMVLVRMDMLLLENQLPFNVLKLLSPLEDAALLDTVDEFLRCNHLSQEKPRNQLQKPTKGDGEYKLDVQASPPPLHLLDRLRWNVLRYFRLEKCDLSNDKTTYRNIQELKAAGIRVRRSKSKCPIDITFSSGLFSGQLRIPKIVVDETIAPTYLNLMAYEVCPDFENNYEISSYVEFLDSLIDHPEDVKELRANEVLRNCLGSDEDVAELFNVISTDLVPDTRIYACVRAKMEEHYEKKYKTWFAQVYHTHLSNPWAITAVIAAFLALLLTSIQTWFAAFPKSK